METVALALLLLSLAICQSIKLILNLIQAERAARKKFMRVMTVQEDWFKTPLPESDSISHLLRQALLAGRYTHTKSVILDRWLKLEQRLLKAQKELVGELLFRVWASNCLTALASLVISRGAKLNMVMLAASLAITPVLLFLRVRLRTDQKRTKRYLEDATRTLVLDQPPGTEFGYVSTLYGLQMSSGQLSPEALLMGMDRWFEARVESVSLFWHRLAEAKGVLTFVCSLPLLLCLVYVNYSRMIDSWR